MVRRFAFLSRRALAVLGGAALGLALVCCRPAAEQVTPSAGALSAAASVAPSSPPPPRPEDPSPSASSPPAPSAPASASASVASPHPEVPDSSSSAAAPEPPEQSPAKARGRCSGWDKLQTPKGEVNCYPFRCRDDRCLTRCQRREDCAGSLGPADLAEHGWPLDCLGKGSCYPLPPSHVRPR